MVLSTLTPAKGSNKGKKKIGRGNGAGHGQTACRGRNGANSRSGSKHYPWFEGGQMPLQRRLPKRGFVNHFDKDYTAVNLGDISERLSGATVVDAAFLRQAGLIKAGEQLVKVLGNGELSKAVTIKADAFSKSAIVKIEKAGGKAELPVKVGK